MARARIAVLVAGMLAALGAASPADAAVKVTKDVRYGSGATAKGRAALALDLYARAGRAKGRRPVVVLIHGGGFRLGTRTNAGLVRVARGLASRGIVAASIGYRILPQDPRPSARVRPLVDALPAFHLRPSIAAAVDDTLTAVAYLRRNAERLRIDPGRLGIIGGSAGAITADHVAYALDDLRIRGPRVRFVGSLWGGFLVEPGARLLERGEAPLFAVHGDADPTVNVELSDELAARARKQRVRVEYHRIEGGRHGYFESGFFTAKVAGDRTPYAQLLRFAARELRRR